MADDKLEIKSPEGTEIKTEVKDVAKPEPTQVELDAAERGWRPKDEWEGNPDEWRSAREFVERGEWIGKFRAKDREIAQIKDALQFMSEQNKKIYENGYKSALDDLKTKKRQALSEGNLVEADEIGDKIEDTKKALDTIKQAPTAPVNPRVDPEHEAWLVKNPWYNDEVMQTYADAVAIKFIKSHNGQVPASEVRTYVATEVKKEFAHRFPKPKAAPQPDGEGRTQGNGKGNAGAFTEAEGSMTEVQRSIMKTIIKTTGMSKEEYMKQFTGQV